MNSDIKRKFTRGGRRDRTQKYRHAIQSCRDRARNTKIHLQLNLARNVKVNKGEYYKYINRKEC